MVRTAITFRLLDFSSDLLLSVLRSAFTLDLVNARRTDEEYVQLPDFAVQDDIVSELDALRAKIDIVKALQGKTALSRESCSGHGER